MFSIIATGLNKTYYKGNVEAQKKCSSRALITDFVVGALAFCVGCSAAVNAIPLNAGYGLLIGVAVNSVVAFSVATYRQWQAAKDEVLLREELR